MKLSPLLLVGSLAANLALGAALLFRTPASSTPSVSSVSGHQTVPGPVAARRAGLADSHSTAPATDPTFATSGPEADARDLAVGRAFSRLFLLDRASHVTPARWWSTKRDAPNPEFDAHARREFSDALIKAFGIDPYSDDADDIAFLPAAKRDALRQITQDYEEMLARFGATGIELPSDREKQKLLRAERDRDIAALLTPEELATYQMHTSATSQTVKERFGEAIASEEEFARIYALQKSFDDRFPREALSGTVSAETIRARTEAERQLQADLAAAVGPERYAALQRAADSELRNLDNIVSRLNLPGATTDHIAAARDAYAAESQRLNADTSLGPAQRRQQIAALATKARVELTAALGAEGTQTYLPYASWISTLENGTAFSLTPPDGTLNFPGMADTYPVPPPDSAARKSGAAPRATGVNEAPQTPASAITTSAPSPAPKP